MKTCPKCKVEKELGEFAKDKAKKDGLNSQCRACCKIYREEHKEQIRVLMKADYQKNKEYRLAYRKMYVETHREQVLAGKKAEYDANKHQHDVRRKISYEKNKDQQRANGRAWYRANRQKSLAQSKAYRDVHKEELRAYHKDWYKSNKDKVVVWGKIYRETNKERINTRQKAYLQSPQGQQTDRRKRYKKRAILAGAEHEPYTSVAILWQQGRKCWICLVALSEQNYSLDHLHPITKGGPDKAENLKPACRSCNSWKGNRIPTQKQILARRKEQIAKRKKLAQLPLFDAA